MRVLVACEFSGIVRDAFRRRGHEAYSCDLLPSERGGPHMIGDAVQIIKGWPYYFDPLEPWGLVIAFPPCTHLAVSGARWFKDKREEQEQAIRFVESIWNAGNFRMCIENPVGILSTRSILGKPTQIIQPWMFGHGETKATCLWLKNLPPLKPTNIVEGREGRIWKEPPSPDRWKHRSRTYQGIADAMAGQWGSL
jgi:hypothetical protein